MLKCHHLKGNQLWEYDPVVSEGVSAEANFAFLSADSLLTHSLTVCFCVFVREQKLTLIHVNSNQCLDKASEEDSQVPSVRDCTHSRSQQWLLRNVTLPEVF